MALEMSERDKIIRVHNGMTDFGFLHIVAILYGHQRLVGSLQTVGDDNMAAGGEGVIAVDISGIEMIQGIFSASDIQSIAVCQKSLSPIFLHDVHDHFCVVGAKIRKVARFAEMNFNGRVAIRIVQLINSRFLYKMAKLLK